MLIKRIKRCIAKVFCNMLNMECLGKDIDAQELLLKKLLIAKMVAEYDPDCDLECFIMKHCKTC